MIWIVSLLFLLLVLVSLPVSFFIRINLPRLEDEDSAFVDIQLKYVGILIYKKAVSLSMPGKIGNFVAKWKEKGEIGRWIEEVWQHRQSMLACLSWYRFSMPTPPLHILLYYRVGGPAKTGMICGYLAAFAGMIPSGLVKFVNCPDFESRYDHFYGDAKVTVIPSVVLIISFVVLLKLAPLYFNKYLKKSSSRAAIPV